MAMNSWEEDALLESHGWWKNLIKRQWEYETDDAIVTISFDEIMGMGQSAEGEEQLRFMAREVPAKVRRLQDEKR